MLLALRAVEGPRIAVSCVPFVAFVSIESYCWDNSESVVTKCPNKLLHLPLSSARDYAYRRMERID